MEFQLAERVIVDHSSVAWATDEGIGAEKTPPGTSNQDITIQNSYIAETLWNGNHPCSNPHSRGLVASDGSTRVSLHHNFLISNNKRNPSVQATNSFQPPDCPDPPGPSGEVVDVRWNLTYNFGHKDQPSLPLQGKGLHFGQGIQANVVGNWLREGQDTKELPGLPMRADDRCDSGTEVFLQCNCRIVWDDGTGLDPVECPGVIVDDDCPGVLGAMGTMQEDLVEGPGVDSDFVDFVASEFPVPAVTERLDPDLDFLTYSLNKAGALPHDHWDRKFLRDYQGRNGDLGAVNDEFPLGMDHDDLEAEVLMHPPDPGTQWEDLDCDGIDDAWETADTTGCYDVDPGCCINWTGCTNNDALQDCQGSVAGYTDLEEYLHGRAQALEDRVLFADEFEDRVDPVDWTFSQGDTWVETRGYLEGTLGGGTGSSSALAKPVFQEGCTLCSVSATLQAFDGDGSSTSHVRLVGWHVDGGNFVAVSLRPAGGQNGQIIREQWSGGSLIFRETSDALPSQPVVEGQDYDLKITYDEAIAKYHFFIAKTGDELVELGSNDGVESVQDGSVGFAAVGSNLRASRIDAVTTQ